MKYSIRGFHFIHKLLKGIPNWGHNCHMGWQQIWIVLPLVSIDYTWDYICFQGVPIWGSICNISYHPQMFQGSPLLGFSPPIDWGYFLQMDTPLVPYLPHCLKQFLQGISPWGHICHIEWNLFYKVFPLGALAATLVEKIGWVFFCKRSPLGSLSATLAEAFYKGFFLWDVGIKWSEMNSTRGYLFGAQLPHWLTSIFEEVPPRGQLSHCLPQSFQWVTLGIISTIPAVINYARGSTFGI